MKERATGTGWGFDTRSLDKGVRPQDDFYRFANGGWLKKNKIPATESRWGCFTILRYETERQLHALISKLLKGKHGERTREQLVADLYRSAIDMKRRNALGTRPIEALRARIRSLSSKDELLKIVAHLHRIGVSPLWSVYLEQDSKKSSRYLLHLFQGGLGLPERDYYLKDGPEQLRVRNAYRVHMRRLLALLGVEKSRVAIMEKEIMALETALANASMRKEDVRDVDKTYHLRTLAAFSQEAPQFDWEKYFTLLGIQKLKELVVGQPLFFRKTTRLLASEPLETWKSYLEWHLLSDMAPLLSEPFVKEAFNFDGRILAGTKKMKPLWRRALAAVNGNLGNALGKLYVDAHFPPDAKRKMDRLVSDLFHAYEKRIRNLDWMGAATKRKAIRKLHALNPKIGYPKKWKKYGTLEMRPDDFFGNMLRISAFEHRRFLKKLRGPVDRDEWFMTPQTVNAYCHFNLNDITFPAAILQPPFFSLRADDAVNYGAIGSTIAHEMTHAFDDQGSKFDEKGNMRQWWTLRDRKRFEKKGKALVHQYDEYEAAPGVHVNGRLTLGENIADLGGLTIAYDAYQTHLEKNGRKNIGGWTPEERFFLGFAQVEQELVRDEFEKMAALTDPHAPGRFRINGTLTHFTPFYETFKAGPKNKLWRLPVRRVKIW